MVSTKSLPVTEQWSPPSRTTRWVLAREEAARLLSICQKGLELIVLFFLSTCMSQEEDITWRLSISMMMWRLRETESSIGVPRKTYLGSMSDG